VDTRYPAEVPAVFRPGCWKIQSCRSSEFGSWPSRARTSLLIIRACRSHFALCGRAWRRLGSPASDLRPGASGCGACPTRTVTPANQPPFPLPATYLGFSAFVLYFSLFLCTVCLCVAQVLLEFF